MRNVIRNFVSHTKGIHVVETCTVDPEKLNFKSQFVDDRRIRYQLDKNTSDKFRGLLIYLIQFPISKIL